MADVEVVNDPEGTGVNVALITEAAQSVAHAINADSGAHPTLSQGQGFGGVATLDGGVNISWNIEATSSHLAFNAVSLDAVIVMINEGPELAMDGFARE
jgi:hypothetical protein